MIRATVQVAFLFIENDSCRFVRFVGIKKRGQKNIIRGQIIFVVFSNSFLYVPPSFSSQNIPRVCRHGQDLHARSRVYRPDACRHQRKGIRPNIGSDLYQQGYGRDERAYLALPFRPRQRRRQRRAAKSEDAHAAASPVGGRSAQPRCKGTFRHCSRLRLLSRRNHRQFLLVAAFGRDPRTRHALRRTCRHK